MLLSRPAGARRQKRWCNNERLTATICELVRCSGYIGWSCRSQSPSEPWSSLGDLEPITVSSPHLPYRDVVKKYWMEGPCMLLHVPWRKDVTDVYLLNATFAINVASTRLFSLYQLSSAGQRSHNLYYSYCFYPKYSTHHCCYYTSVFTLSSSAWDCSIYPSLAPFSSSHCPPIESFIMTKTAQLILFIYFCMGNFKALWS